MRPHTRMTRSDEFKLGLFAMNCSNGMTMTKAPERWDASWENNMRAAQLADDAGLDFLLPIGRWQGYKGETDTEGSSFETLTWASGLLGATKHISVSGTLHVAFVNPVFAAKQIVTADHIGAGRFMLNIVSGWNAGEFSMLGLPLNDHEARYAYTEEWVHIAKRIWTEDEPFNHAGRFFNLENVILKPKPYGGGHPLLISAGNSPEGRSFAANHANCLFMTIKEMDTLQDEVNIVRQSTLRPPSDVGIYASGHLICRPTRKEAEDFYNYIVYEQGDWEAAEHAAYIRTKGRKTAFDDMKRLKERLISGVGTYPVVGSYDDAADSFKKMSEAGLNGIALGLVHYINDLPALRDEVLPRLRRLGLRH
jgi:dimethylsulfone monooxygenase